MNAPPSRNLRRPAVVIVIATIVIIASIFVLSLPGGLAGAPKTTTTSSVPTPEVQSFLDEAQSRLSTPYTCGSRVLPSNVFGISNSTFLGLNPVNASYITSNSLLYQYKVLEIDNQSYLSGSMYFNGYTITLPAISATYSAGPPTQFDVYRGIQLLGSYTYVEIAFSIIQYGAEASAIQIGPLLFLFVYTGTCSWFNILWLVMAPVPSSG